MKPLPYKDGSPSREVGDDDDDWETTGQDEMNNLHADCKQKKSILDVRDALINLRDLVCVCGVALLADKTDLEDRSRIQIAHVLFFYVDSIIKDLEQELARR